MGSTWLETLFIQYIGIQSGMILGCGLFLYHCESEICRCSTSSVRRTACSAVIGKFTFHIIGVRRGKADRRRYDNPREIGTGLDSSGKSHVSPILKFSPARQLGTVMGHCDIENQCSRTGCTCLCVGTVPDACILSRCNLSVTAIGDIVAAEGEKHQGDSRNNIKSLHWKNLLTLFG